VGLCHEMARMGKESCCRAVAVAMAVLVMAHRATITAGHCVVTQALGCFKDAPSSRLLPYPGPRAHWATLTVSSCLQLCHDKAFTFAGVEDGNQCFCGNGTAHQPTPVAMSECNIPCESNATETCGGRGTIELMHFQCQGRPDPTPPPIAPPPPTPPPPPPPPRPAFKKGSKNVLFIATDDMRAELGTYGSDYMTTPNLDRLAASGTLFERGYIAVSVCMPSRTALLTSRRPDTTRNYELTNSEYHRNVVNATTIPQFFKEQGYITKGCGKIFHYLPSEELKYSWDDQYPSGYCTPSLDFEPTYYNPNSGSPSGNLDSCLENVTDDELSTGMMTVGTLKTLQWIVDARQNGTLEADRPFFVGVGYHRPHEPYVSPKKYCDLYPDPDTTNTSIRLPPHIMPPEGMPDVAWSISGFVKGHPDVVAAYNSTYHNATLNAACHDSHPETANVTLQLSEQCLVPLWKTARMRQAYWGAISYVDAMVGRLLNGLDDLKLADSTIVVFWGDHGYQLGDYGCWEKYTNFEMGTRIPLMMRVPGIPPSRTAALVESVDIMPSLAEAAMDVIIPQCSPGTTGNGRGAWLCTEGHSWVASMRAPNDTSVQKAAAFSQYARPNHPGNGGVPYARGLPPYPVNVPVMGGTEGVMGYTIRVDKWRYTEWVAHSNNNTNADWNGADWSRCWGRELYSHELSPVPNGHFDYESINLVDRPENKDLVAQLSKQLHSGWRPQLPPRAGGLEASSTP